MKCYHFRYCIVTHLSFPLFFPLYFLLKSVRRATKCQKCNLEEVDRGMFKSEFSDTNHQNILKTFKSTQKSLQIAQVIPLKLMHLSVICFANFLPFQNFQALLKEAKRLPPSNITKSTLLRSMASKGSNTKEVDLFFNELVNLFCCEIFGLPWGSFLYFSGEF